MNCIKRIEYTINSKGLISAIVVFLVFASIFNLLISFIYFEIHGTDDVLFRMFIIVILSALVACLVSKLNTEN